MSTWIRNKLPVKIKRLHPDAVIPRYTTELAAGFDLVAVTEGKLPPGEHAIIPTGIAVEIPEGYIPLRKVWPCSQVRYHTI
jgi:dUTP pyrophosphatase